MANQEPSTISSPKTLGQPAGVNKAMSELRGALMQTNKKVYVVSKTTLFVLKINIKSMTLSNIM